MVIRDTRLWWLLMDDLLTYAEVGATRGELPAGYRHLRRTGLLGFGDEVFRRSSESLMTWGMHRGAGLSVSATQTRVALGVEARIGWSAGPVRLTAPCRVVYVVNDAEARGFAYGSLPGHPERGEESFTVRLARDGEVRLAIVAFSRPARWYAILGAPVTRLVQHRITSNYLRAMIV